MSRRTLAHKSRKGQGLVEYIIIVAAVALIALVAVSMFGHKVADQYAIGSGMLPGAHAEDNAPIATGEFARFNEGDGFVSGNGQVTWADITGNTVNGEMDNNVVTNNSNLAGAFVLEEEDE